MVEQAKQELEMLETQYPNRFGYLKMELKSFILSLESQYCNNMLYSENPISLPNYSTATTQASTSRKRKNSGVHEMVMTGRNVEASEQKFQNVERKLKRRNRIDFVLEKAESCLRKIEEVKASLLLS